MIRDIMGSDYMIVMKIKDTWEKRNEYLVKTNQYTADSAGC